MSQPERLACVRAVDKGGFNWHVVDWLSWQLHVGMVVRIHQPLIRLDVP